MDGSHGLVSGLMPRTVRTVRLRKLNDSAQASHASIENPEQSNGIEIPAEATNVSRNIQ